MVSRALAKRIHERMSVVPISVKRAACRTLATALVAPVLASCNKPPENFTIKFPDATFVVKYDWVPAHIRAQAVTIFEINIPSREAPAEAVELDRKVMAVERGFMPDLANYRLHLKYLPTPVPGGQFTILARIPGWVFLPDDPTSEYRTAVHGPSPQFNAERQEYYEWKKDTRYTIRCGYFRTGGVDEILASCAMDVPYREFAGEKCTQLGIGFAIQDFQLWPEIARQKRNTLRLYETQPSKKEN